MVAVTSWGSAVPDEYAVVDEAEELGALADELEDTETDNVDEACLSVVLVEGADIGAIVNPFTKFVPFSTCAKAGLHWKSV